MFLGLCPGSGDLPFGLMIDAGALRVEGTVKNGIEQFVGGGERLGHFGGPERAKPLQCDGDKNVASPHRVLIESLPQ